MRFDELKRRELIQAPSQPQHANRLTGNAARKIRPSRRGGIRIKCVVVLLIVIAGVFPARLEAQYKPEFKMSVVVNRENSWGRAAVRFADAVKFRTQGRITIKNYFEGQLFAGEQTTEFQLLERGVADFAIGSVFNWSSEVKEVNLFALPFLLPSYRALDAVEAGEPGKRVVQSIEGKGVVPIAWGENGFREVTNSKRPIRQPEDLRGLNIRVPGIPILADIFRALGANPVSMNFDKAQQAFREGTVDGQENPVALIIPYEIWAVHKYVTLWHYAIDPLILAVNARTWMSFSPDDRKVIQQIGDVIMAEQKREARDGLENATIVIDMLQKIYEMEVSQLSQAEVEVFRARTRTVYDNWANVVGIDLVRSAEKIVERSK